MKVVEYGHRPSWPSLVLPYTKEQVRGTDALRIIMHLSCIREAIATLPTPIALCKQIFHAPLSEIALRKQLALSTYASIVCFHAHQVHCVQCDLVYDGMSLL